MLCPLWDTAHCRGLERRREMLDMPLAGRSEKREIMVFRKNPEMSAFEEGQQEAERVLARESDQQIAEWREAASRVTPWDAEHEALLKGYLSTLVSTLEGK